MSAGLGKKNVLKWDEWKAQTTGIFEQQISLGLCKIFSSIGGIRAVIW